MNDGRFEEVLGALARHGFEEAEVFWKRGRGRRVELDGADHAVATTTQEEGWAVRAGDHRGSIFARATGAPDPDLSWPAPAGALLRLPEPSAPTPSTSMGARPALPADLDAPLLAEAEGHALLETIARELRNELPGARLVHAVLEEGVSESDLANSRGLRAAWRSRVASLHLEAVSPGESPQAARLDHVERRAMALRPAAIARRMADRLEAARTGAAPERDRGEMLLAPAVGVQILRGLLPLLVGARGSALAEAWRDQRGRLGSELLTIVDDGGRVGSPLQAPNDGEGVPTREMVLVDGGVFRQPLVSWREARPPELRASGCSLRASWRDLPTAGPTQLFVRPRPEIGVAALLNGVARGFYLLDTTGPGRIDLAADRFALPVCGYAVQSGRATAPVAKAWLCGSLSAFLRGIQGVARDLTFYPVAGLLGAPSLLVVGLEVRREPPAPV